MHILDRATQPGAARDHAVTETWPIEARRLLAVLVVAMAIGLLTVRPDWSTSPPKAFASAPELVLDANSAPPQVIEALPTLAALVRRWVVARAERPFSSLDDARRRVRGLGPASLLQIAPYLRFPLRGISPSDALDSRLASRSKRDLTKTAHVTDRRLDRLAQRR